jgi:hypothetical protein
MRMIMWVFIVYLPRTISISYLPIIAQCLSMRQKTSLGLNKESGVLLHTLNVRVSSPFMCLHSPWRHGYPRWRRGMKTTTQVWSMKSPSCILTILLFTFRILCLVNHDAMPNSPHHVFIPHAMPPEGQCLKSYPSPLATAQSGLSMSFLVLPGLWWPM